MYIFINYQYSLYIKLLNIISNYFKMHLHIHYKEINNNLSF